MVKYARCLFGVRSLVVFMGMLVWLPVGNAQSITPSPYWKNEVVFPRDPFSNRGFSRESASWIKFTILLLEPYDSNVVYFQDSSRDLVYHYSFGTQYLEPFIGMNQQQFNAVTLYKQNQQAIVGTVIFPPGSVSSQGPDFDEIGIQFVRQDAFSREEIAHYFDLVKSEINTSVDTSFYYFPTFEQQAAAEADKDWFEAHGIALGSTAQWSSGNVCYSEGWCLGEIKFVTATDIHEAYQTGTLKPNDILLTDGIPAELPPVAGILSLAPSTPNSHVAILARTYIVPFSFLALAEDAALAQSLVGRTVVFSAYNNDMSGCYTRLIDITAIAGAPVLQEILALKEPEPLNISPMQTFGAFHVSTESLHPKDVCFAGGKASNFSILRSAIPNHSPRSIALTFDLWNAFLDQPLKTTPRLDLAPGEYIILWADGNPERGVTHMDFKLRSSGESIVLSNAEGVIIDSIRYPQQYRDVSWGRITDGGEQWQLYSVPTPGRANADLPAQPNSGLVINEFMASNGTALEDPNRPGAHPDWIELYNGSSETISLNGMFLSDDPNNPYLWQIPYATGGGSLRKEILTRLAPFSFPPDIAALNHELAIIRHLFVTPEITNFNETLQAEVLNALSNPLYDFDPDAMLRFRSSTNVEDGEDYTGAGLYDSFSGCLADDLALDDDGPCRCDPNRESSRSVFRAIRRTFASFYNENAFLERLRRDVNELDVGMAVLVHHSFPDENELANGVATVERDGESGKSQIVLVTQQGATSVTNPEDGSTPEEATLNVYASGSLSSPRIQRESSLVPLGGKVMQWKQDYLDLASLLARISEAFSAITGKRDYTLDLEYKKVGPGDQALPEGGLVVKQVRQVPEPNQSETIPTFLLSQPTRFQVYPGEFNLFETTDVFADHRLKCRWTFTPHTMPLNRDALEDRMYAEVEMEYVAEGQIRTIKSEMSLLPHVQHGLEGDQSVLDRWVLDGLSNPRDYEMETTAIPFEVPAGEDPLFLLSDFGDYAFNVPYRCHELNVSYEFPVAAWDQHAWLGNPAEGLQHAGKNKLYLWSPPEASEDDVFVERVYSENGIAIRTSFYFPPPPPGYPNWVVHTAPLLRWEQTEIEGLTDDPIVLKGFYSQTIRPEHHNLTEHFLFEPALEPEISPTVLEQLEARDIHFIHLILDNIGRTRSSIITYSRDDIK